MLTGCDSSSAAEPSPSAADAKNGDGAPVPAISLPARPPAGQEWPEHPVCGDFDGDGSTDLAVTASDGRISFLRGPFARTGAPAGAELLPDGGPYLDAPSRRPTPTVTATATSSPPPARARPARGPGAPCCWAPRTARRAPCSSPEPGELPELPLVRP
ncbi:hypothetical protein AMK21_05505 [Streptomyces sp. CB00316]|uniref:FG-GAP repeat domain-containing protein n=1 Tax=Streptomyces sp. CB00316 TaxID=1703932 RepID=UPI00093DDC2A|nr:FG-GAP repeat protein [Streptomyces sp. CB00316]OKJ22513.1 hypothetical protein AMK21_05505 [Streptomyces sp. CB00316]